MQITYIDRVNNDHDNVKKCIGNTTRVWLSDCLTLLLALCYTWNMYYTTSLNYTSVLYSIYMYRFSFAIQLHHFYDSDPNNKTIARKTSQRQNAIVMLI